jgi:hypothetical protein
MPMLPLLAVAVIVRVILLPLNHTWDLQTWNNLFADLANGQSPYETLRYMTFSAQASRLVPYPWYEYYAYPPVAIYLYAPLAKLYDFLAGAPAYVWSAYSSIVVLPADLLLSLLFKLPLMLADGVTAWMLARLTRPGIGVAYLLNPLTLLVGNWTFDALMVCSIVAAALLAERERYAWAAVALGIGAATKFIAGLLLPTLLIYLLHRRAPGRVILHTAVAFTATVAVLCAPFLDGLLFTLRFHAERHGGGMTWHYAFHALARWLPEIDWSPVFLSLSAQLGATTLALGLISTYALLALRAGSLPTMWLITLLGFFASSKLVNEPYALALLPLALVVAVRAAISTSWRLYHLLWGVPFAFAALNVPLPAFLLSPALALGLTDKLTIAGFHHAYLTGPFPYIALVLTVLGLSFTLLCIGAIVCYAAVPLVRSESARLTQPSLRGLATR